MANLNIKFNNKNYSIDSASLADAIARLEAHLADMMGERLEGDGQEFYTMAPSTLSFRSTAPLNELQDVQINGQTVDPSNYTLEEGSTIVKLKYDYLSTLDVGSYELSVVSDSKTVKGDFTVAAPELNEYGFYYNVPYYVSVHAFIGFTSVIVFRPDNTANIYQIDTSNTYEVVYTYDSGVISFNFLNTQVNQECPFNGSFSNEGKDLSGIVDLTDPWFIGSGPIDITLTVDVDKVATDDTYVYVTKAGVYIEYFPHAKTLIDYPMPRNNLLSKPVQTVAYEAFMEYHTMRSALLPSTVITIEASAFSHCTSLTSITIPDSVTRIGYNAFCNCESLSTITFEGTIAQWNAITKGEDWNQNVPATHVHCIDGDVAL